MKKLLLILFISFLANQIKSQVVFCPPGAEWRYLFTIYAFSYIEVNNTIKYVGDTVIGNETVKVLTYHYFYPKNSGGLCHSTFIKQKGDTVFMRNCYTSNTWQILYNFAATVGQHWVTMVKDSSAFGINTPVTHTVSVNAITTVTINNMPLKKLLVSYCYVSLFSGQLECATAEITERIGCVPYLFNYNNRPTYSDYEEIRYFLCYKDNTFGVKEFSAKSCDYFSVGLPENILIADKIKLYPMPVNESLNIDFTNNMPVKHYDVKIVNALGQTVLSPRLQTTNTRLELNVGSLNSGVYFLQVFDNGTLCGVQKIIKE